VQDSFGVNEYLVEARGGGGAQIKHLLTHPLAGPPIAPQTRGSSAFIRVTVRVRVNRLTLTLL